MQNSDPLTNVAGVTALFLAVNLPFYSIFLYLVISVAAWPAWLALLPVPFYVAVPAMARRHSLAGRAMLPIVGIANVVVWLKLFGVASGVELYLLVCVLLCAILFRPGERIVMVVVLALSFIVYTTVGRNLVPMQVLSADAYTAFFIANALGVAVLILMVGLMLAALLHERQI
jgi:hypothetical protein